MINKCQVCHIEFETTKEAKTCSPKCRVTLARLRVTNNPNVTLDKPFVTHDVTFKFTVKGHKKVREEKYWYNIPLSAIPIYEKNYPKMPKYMNGREYFLWWKNEFKTEKDQPLLFNPFPKHDTITYEMGGESSRKWGA